MIIRVQGSDGTKRIELLPTDTTKTLYEKVFKEFGCEGKDILLCRKRDRKTEIKLSKSSASLTKFSNGDMVFLLPSASAAAAIAATAAAAAASAASASSSQSGNKEGDSKQNPGTSALSDRRNSDVVPFSSNEKQKQRATSIKSDVVEHDIDQQLAKLDGRIDRNRNPTMCRHAGNSKCIHCSALDPWDENHLKENKIKHSSFHSHLRKLTSGVDKGKFVYLENLSCRIKPGCTDHPPWPEAICSKCQPSAITLNRQNYRHVDNVMFENPHLVERFLNYWRVSGHQRIGFLFGRYETHLDVPLGIKATVAAIYEPPQEGDKDQVRLLLDPKREMVDEIANGLDLQCVGWIFTDLVPQDAVTGTVRHLRHADTHFMSAHEVITAAHFQDLHPNPCRFSPDGVYGSKFATVIVTGDSTNQVHMEGYQVSNQCQSLVRDKCLLPTKDFPELAYIRESSSSQYVPDVYFREKDQYGNEVVRLGRPLPVEYLLLDCPVSTPVTPLSTFAVNTTLFPVENRLLEDNLQDFAALVKYLKGFSDQQFLEAVSDFHFLIFIAMMDMLPLREYMAPLLTAVSKHDVDAALKWKNEEQWATVEQLILASNSAGMGTSTADASAPSMPTLEPEGATSSASAGAGNSQTTWTCSHCTFINQSVDHNDVCDMCHLPH